MSTAPITKITLANLAYTHGSYATAGQYNISFQAKGDTSGTIRFSYSWRPVGSSEWFPAVVTGGTSATVGTSFNTVNAVFDLGASDDFTGETSLNLEFKVEAISDAVASTGSLTFSAGSAYSGGETFTVNGTTYEFTLDGEALVDNVPVLITGLETAAEVAAAAAADLEIDKDLVVSVTGSTVHLVAANAGAAGNVAIVASTGITASGFANGSNAAIADSTISIIGADTNAIGEAQTIMTTNTASYTSGKVVTAIALDGFGARPFGTITQGYARKTVAYKMIDMLRKGEIAKFDIDPDHYGKSLRRGVLVSVDEWNRVRGTNSFSIELKAKQWFAWYANKGLSRPSFFENGTKVYALFESKIVAGRTYQTIIAYLLSGETYAELASAAP